MKKKQLPSYFSIGNDDIEKSIHKSHLDFDYELEAISKKFAEHNISWRDVLREQFGLVLKPVSAVQLKGYCPRCGGIETLNVVLNPPHPTFHCACNVQTFYGNSLVDFILLFEDLKRSEIVRRLKYHLATYGPKPVVVNKKREKQRAKEFGVHKITKDLP